MKSVLIIQGVLWTFIQISCAAAYKWWSDNDRAHHTPSHYYIGVVVNTAIVGVVFFCSCAELAVFRLMQSWHLLTMREELA